MFRGGRGGGGRWGRAGVQRGNGCSVFIVTLRCSVKLMGPQKLMLFAPRRGPAIATNHHTLLRTNIIII